MQLDSQTMTLFTIVATFWIIVIGTARTHHRPWFPNIPVLAIFFFAIGVLLNRMRPFSGMYIIGGIHALLLVMLGFKLLSQKK